MLVDDHPMMRAGLAQLINGQTDLQVCHESDHPAAALESLARVKVDILVTDLTMPGRSGIEFVKDVHALRPELPILVLSMHDEVLYAERVLRAGGRGYIMKDAGAGKLLDAIRQVLAGTPYVSPAMSARLLEGLGGRPRGSTSPMEKLSDREFEVFRLLGNGRTTKEIAGELGLSPKTVAVHREHLKKKLGLKDGTALLRQAVRWVEAQSTPS
jgi:DNA-binding NarL/FixJ family response regulator